MTGLVTRALVVASILAVAIRADASPISIVEQNNTSATAQNVDGAFSLDFSADIGDQFGSNTSLLIPHVTIDASGVHANNAPEYDWYEFTVAGPIPFDGITGIFDLDYGMEPPEQFADGWFHAILVLTDAAGTPLVSNYGCIDCATKGAGGSYHNYDPFIEYVFMTAGVYKLMVGDTYSNQGGVPYALFDPENPERSLDPDYVLQISLEGHALAEATPVPEPASMTLVGAGLLAGYRSVRGRRTLTRQR